MTGYRILVVDDDPQQRELLRDMLEMSGFFLTEAENGSHCLEIVRQSPESFDLILLDLQMPVMDGFATLSALSADPNLSDIQVLMLTSHDRPNLRVRGLELGAEDYIAKPFHHAELLARVKAALRRGNRYRNHAGKLSGDLSSMHLFDLLSTLELGGRSVRVELADISAMVEMKSGRFSDARFLEFSGPDALFRIFLEARGSFFVQFDPADLESPVGGSMGALMLDAARAMDEWTRVVPELADSAIWWEAGPGHLPEWVNRILPARLSSIIACSPDSPDVFVPELRRWLDEKKLVPVVFEGERKPT